MGKERIEGESIGGEQSPIRVGWDVLHCEGCQSGWESRRIVALNPDSIEVEVTNLAELRNGAPVRENPMKI